MSNEINSKYKNVYTSGSEDTRVSHYEANKNIYGDAIYETSNSGDVESGSWYSDYSYMPYSSSSFFHRGGYFNHDSSAGVFRFNGSNGIAAVNHSFRPVVFVK